MTTRAQIVAAAQAWIRTPYQHQASLRGVGVDCIGLIRGAARDAGLVDPFAAGMARDYEGYSAKPNPRLLLAACYRFMNPIEVESARLADVLVFAFPERGIKDPQHFGIISRLDPTYIIHSIAPFRVVEHRVDEVWRSRIVGAFRLRGVSD
jgi:NlpC/P60 family putative phage cell wall peptidase